MNGICFIEPLFNKVVTGQKTQTRRIIDHFGNKEHYGKLLCHWGLSRPPYLAETGEWRWELQTAVDDSHSFIIKPKFKVGEIVYLKEPYAETCDEYGTPIIAYKFGGRPRLKLPDSLGCEIGTNWCIDNYPACGKWKNKLFMPESAARHFIEITAVRAERLQDIPEEDCLKEGIEEVIWKGKILKSSKHYFNSYESYDTPIEAYAELIDRINGEGVWERNPYVWVYDFKLVK